MSATLTYTPKPGESIKVYLPIETSHKLASGMALEGRLMAVIPGRHQIATEQGQAILEFAERYPAIASLLDSEQLVVTIEGNDEVDFSELTDAEQGNRISKCGNLEQLITWGKTPALKSWRASQISRKIKRLHNG
jgi:hypothetical protein